MTLSDSTKIEARLRSLADKAETGNYKALYGQTVNLDRDTARLLADVVEKARAVDGVDIYLDAALAALDHHSAPEGGR